MNKILIGWGIDPKFADMFDETIIALLMVHRRGGCTSRGGAQ